MSGNKYKILIVEDEENILKFAKTVPSAHGYHVLCAKSGLDGWMLFESHCPDLVILDLGLPDMDGIQFLKRVRKKSSVPVLVLSARFNEKDKVEALDLGANDYVTKPFDTKELLARIAVQLRDGARREHDRLNYGKLSLHTQMHCAFFDGGEIRLTPTEYAILRQLMRNPTGVVTKSQLLERISLDTPDCTESSLKTHVSNLRKKLRTATGREYIESVWGIGFKLTGKD